MFADHLAEVIGRAQGNALDDVSRALWTAVAAGQVNDDDATRLSEAIQARKAQSRHFGDSENGRMGADRAFAILAKAPSRKPQRPPVRSVAWERRRRLAASGPMPPALAQRFTTGELAVMRIVADEVAARGSCSLCLDAIAARAGVSRSLAKGAIRQARGLGMVEVRERRRTGAKSLPNVVTIIDREWLAWMRRGQKVRQFGEATLADIGGRNLPTTDTRGFREGRSRHRKRLNHHQGSDSAKRSC